MWRRNLKDIMLSVIESEGADDQDDTKLEGFENSRPVSEHHEEDCDPDEEDVVCEAQRSTASDR